MQEYEKKIKTLEDQVNSLFETIDILKEKLANETKIREELVLENRALKKDLSKANQTIENLTLRIKKNSSNSGKPSSTDSIYTKKVHNFREKTNKNIGGQKGHKGHTLEMSKEPTQIIEKKINNCECGGHVENKETYKAKQVVDIRIEVDVIEERVYEGNCSKCGKYHTGKFSDEFKNPVQYGNNIKVLTTLLLDEGYISLNRCAKIIEDLTVGKIKVTEGAMINFKKDIVSKSEETIEQIRQELIKAELLHVDETSARVTGGLGWLHTLTTSTHTLYQIKNNRDPKREDELKILPYYVGTLVHDHLKSYYKYETIRHAECNIHILRYLKAVIETLKRKRAKELLEFLLKIKEAKEKAIKEGKEAFGEEKIKEIELEYLRILDIWEEENARSKAIKKKSKALKEEKLLITRLKEYKEEHLLFAKDFKVPFDNNMAERALRPIKTKLKVSGSFRGKDKGKNFAVIRSVLETAKKHEMNLHETITKILNGEKVQFETA